MTLDQATPCKTVRKPQSAAHKRLYKAFKAWTRHPEQEGFFIELRLAMNDHELRHRLRMAMPMTQPAFSPSHCVD